MSTKRMKILFLTSCDHPLVRLEAEALSKLFNIDYILIEWKPYLLRKGARSLIRNLPKFLIALLKLRIPPFPIKLLLAHLLLASLIMDERKLWGQKYDVIYAHWLFPAGLVGLLFSKILNSKVISVAWGYDIQVIPGVRDYGIQGSKRMLSKAVIEKSDLLITNHRVHKQIAERLAGLPPSNKKIIYIPPAIPDLSLNVKDELTEELKEIGFDHRKLEKTPIVLYSPSLRPHYGIMEFVKAIPIIASSVRDCVFVITGEGELKDEALRFIEDHGLEKKVIFTGRISHDSMRTLYKLSTVVCDLSYAGTGVTTLEAFCFGKPVVAIASPRAVVEHGVSGFLVKRGDYQALANLIVNILEDMNLRRKFSMTAREIYEKEFNMDRRTRALLKIFQSISDEIS
ncbi:MAG: glycosyltransferase [Candidatus Bathyarchaeia archaeon]